MRSVKVNAINLVNGDIIRESDGRNRRIHAVHSHKSNKGVKVYAVITAKSGRGLEFREYAETDRVQVKRSDSVDSKRVSKFRKQKFAKKNSGHTLTSR